MSQGIVAQRRSWDPASGRCGRSHPDKCRDGETCCLNYFQEGHFIRECPKNKKGGGNPDNRAQSSSFASPKRVAPKGANSGTGGGANRLNAITSSKKQENFTDVVTGMIKFFSFDVYALLGAGASYL
ncbi:uncharacterized protein LOC107001555 [Solanum pennellii]|uniref:Uncharacterized protein LOC107001555 n=1 Tax=Solanum pennellii TaxID=28526 RepID=A0ABM1FCR1_SOLPN|nr:uncharacterized protein LOC107001555 [Solanum pennellii]